MCIRDSSTSTSIVTSIANSTETENSIGLSLSKSVDTAVKKRKFDCLFLPGTHLFKNVMSKVFHKLLIEWFDHKLDTKVVDRIGNPIGWDCSGENGETKKQDKSR